MKQLLFSILAAGTLLFSTNQAQAQCITAIELDGVNDYLHSPFANYDFTNFTIEMFINSPDFSPNEVYVNWNQDSRVIFGGWAVDGSFNGGAIGFSPQEINSGAGTTPQTNNWHHVAYVYDGSTQKIYIGGLEVASVPTGGALSQGNAIYNSGLTIGASYTQGQQFTNTQFEDVRIWNVARTGTEIANNAIATLTGSETGLVAYYRFEDGVGSTTVTDLTGNGNTLTLNNMDPATDWIPGVFSQPVQATDVVFNCGAYTWVDGNTYAVDNNTAQYTFVGGAAGGCDSIVTLDLTVGTPADISVTDNSPTFMSNDVSAGVTYQWIDCLNGNAPIPGETNQSFTGSQGGSYAVIVTAANGCRDTSACFDVPILSLDESSLESGLILAPNPTNGVFSISTLTYTGELNIQVMDLTGKLIYTSTENVTPSASANIDLKDAANGVYIVRVSDIKESRSIRVVKK
ncbi:MAG: T9SS type A sorting domain-containing protein [Crocinitomicaceae bacterium]|nr:T9SS type A sorting domain-containing protein [Crocinitomicaceae bacterium]